MAWESVPGNSAGAMNGDGSRKLLLHDTEGSTIEGAIAAYRANNSWPTLTVDCRRRRVVRHLPDTVAARSLQNRPGGADETNKDGSVHIQIEIVGFVNNRDGTMFASREDYVWFGETVVGPLCRRNNIPIVSTVRWVAYDDSYGLNAPQRLSVAAWDAYSGILGHEHAPDNSHGDPGLIDIATILTAARGDDDMAMTPDERKDLIADIAAASAQKTLERVNAAYEKSGSVIRSESRVLARLGVEDAVAPEQPLGEWLAHFDARLSEVEAKVVEHDTPPPEVPEPPVTP